MDAATSEFVGQATGSRAASSGRPGRVRDDPAAIAVRAGVELGARLLRPGSVVSTPSTPAALNRDLATPRFEATPLGLFVQLIGGPHSEAKPVGASAGRRRTQLSGRGGRNPKKKNLRSDVIKRRHHVYLVSTSRDTPWLGTESWDP
jgi:hypothetical protein